MVIEIITCNNDNTGLKLNNGLVKYCKVELILSLTVAKYLTKVILNG